MPMPAGQGITGRPIADELYDDKSPETIATVLKAHLNPTKQTFVVTDLCSSYPRVFGKMWQIWCGFSGLGLSLHADE